MLQTHVSHYDTSGDYNSLLSRLIREGKLSTKPGVVHLVLHADADKALFIPRGEVKKSRQVFINPVDADALWASGNDIYKSCVLLMNGQGKGKAHFILWESETKCLVIPAPQRVTVKRSKGFA